MSWKSFVVLAALAAVLGGFFYYDTYWLTPAREKAESAKGRLWALEPKDVDALTIKRAGDTIRLKRLAAGGWEMLEPVKALGDRATADDVVTSLVTTRRDREIDANPAKLGEFGLEPPAAQVTLDVKDRKEPLTLLVGAKSPTGAWVYAKEGGKPGVMTIPELVGRDTSRPAADFRDKSVIAFDKKSVTGLDLQVGGEDVSVVADQPGNWRIVKPRTYRADADLVSTFLDKLTSAKVKEFVAESPTSLAAYGLDHPAVVTVWTGKDKERSSKTLRFGKVDTAKTGVYVMRAGEPGVMLAPQELWTAVPKTVAILRDKVVVAYAYDKAKRIEVDSARGRVMLERDGAAWKITAPEVLKADSGAVNALLWALRDLRASGFLADAASDAPRLLKKPDVTVKIWEDGAKEPKILLLQASTEARGGKPAALAAVEGQGPVMLVDAKALGDLAKTEMDLRDKSVFPAFDLDQVKRARIVAAGKPVVVERSGESDWKRVEPSRGMTPGVKVTSVFFALKALRWKEIASPKGDDAARYGLEHPELEVSLYKADGAEVGTLLVGKQEGGLTYVRMKSGASIYAVESRLLDDLRKARTEILA